MVKKICKICKKFYFRFVLFLFYLFVFFVVILFIELFIVKIDFVVFDYVVYWLGLGDGFLLGYNNSFGVCCLMGLVF